MFIFVKVIYNVNLSAHTKNLSNALFFIVFPLIYLVKYMCVLYDIMDKADNCSLFVIVYGLNTLAEEL